MAFLKKVIIFVSCIFYSTDYVSALSNEGILAGILAPDTTFTYHVLVEGRENSSRDYTVMGNGAIISNRHVLSASTIFMEASGKLKDRRFSIIAGSNDLTSPLVLRIDVLSVYIPYFDDSFLFSNVAVAKLVGGVGLDVNEYVSKVNLPEPGQNFDFSWAFVTGFGYFKVTLHEDVIYGLPTVTDGILSRTLRFKEVAILSDQDCQVYYAKNVTITNMCGIVQVNEDHEPSGVCIGDLGGPLVIDDVVVGIVSGVTLDCDNTRIGALYMKVSLFTLRIRKFMEETIDKKGLLLYNRPHVLPVDSN